MYTNNNYASPSRGYSLNAQIQNFIDEAEEISESILEPKVYSRVEEEKSHTRLAYYSMGYPLYSGNRDVNIINYNYGNSYHNYNYVPQTRHRESESGDVIGRIIIGLLGAVAACFAASKLGEMFQVLNESSKQIFQDKIVKALVKEQMFKNPNDPELRLIKKIVDARQSMDKHIRRKEMIKTALFASVAAIGVAVAFGAAYAVLSNPVFFGIVGGFAAAVALSSLFNMSYNSNDSTSKNQAKVIQTALRELRMQNFANKRKEPEVVHQPMPAYTPEPQPAVKKHVQPVINVTHKYYGNINEMAYGVN